MRFHPALPNRRVTAGLSLLLLLTWGSWAGHGQLADTPPDGAAAPSPAASPTTSSAPAASSTAAKTASAKTAASHRTTTQTKAQATRAARTARTARIRKAFVASSELRPMAQQLATLRTPDAYAGVTAFAHQHTGDAAGAAYLALGHAYLLDHRYAEAVTNLKLVREDSADLGDVADFLAANADHDSGENRDAELILHGFATRYPDSIFVNQVPELEANVLLTLGNATGARAVLSAAAGTSATNRVGYQLAMAQVELALGLQQTAIEAFKSVLLQRPLSGEAQSARARLTELGAETSLTLSELRTLGDAYYNAGRFSDAAEQYRAMLAHTAGLSDAERNGLAVASAACDLKLKRLTPARVQALPDTDDENGARRLYLLMELARSRGDSDDLQRIVDEMETRFARSEWLAEALYSSGNMYLLKHDYPNAITYYGYLADHFPANKYASPAHWRAGWLSYRQGLYADAARIFDAQIRQYPAALETVSALYWRGRLYETQDHTPGQAVSNYRAIVRAFPHYFYSQMAQLRLKSLGKGAGMDATEREDARLSAFQPLPEPKLVDTFPADSPSLAKARLLANAGLNEYVAPEIQADPDSSTWSVLAEAEIYSSYDESYRALRAMKRALPNASTAPIATIPLAYWRILFPEPWWPEIREASAKNNLDPYLVASLIRQESEFNPNAVSRANAYGLMQMLPSVGKSMAREEGLTKFQTFQLLDPATNIRLGTRYLRQMIDKFGGVEEYALAAYNAGDNRVTDWQAAGPYTGIDEFVESIPFTETRDYVQAIMRNEETYRAIDTFSNSHQGMTTAAR